jgi:hypothetical protein
VGEALGEIAAAGYDGFDKMGAADARR